jgi:glutaminase-like protein
LRRNTAQVAQLKAAYQAAYGEDLRDRLVDEMSGTELQNALYLMGEEQDEIRELSEEEAQRVFTALSGATFTDDTGAEAPIPFHYPVDGCYARAHLMAEMLTAAGISSEKVFAVSTYPEGLNVASDYAEDMPQGQPGNVRWWYHVAPIVRVRDAQGTVQQMVLDPSTAQAPITIAQWTGQMSSGAFRQMTVPELQQHLQANSGDYAADQRIVFTAPRTSFYPGGGFDEPTSAQADSRMEAVRGRLGGYARRAELHEVAAVIRRELANPITVDVSGIVTAIQGTDPAARPHLWTLFPNLREDLAAQVTPWDMAEIDAAVGAAAPAPVGP